MTEYQTVVACPDCDNTQPFNGKIKPRAHTRCGACKKDFYVVKNIVPTDYNDNADKQIDITETDNYTDFEGNIYADTVPTRKKKKWEIPKMSIGGLRSIYRQIFYKDPPHDSEHTKKKIIEIIVVELEKL